MIKIAFIIDTIESPSAGTEKQLLLLIRHLDRSRFQPYLCVLRGSEWLEKEFDLCPLFVARVKSFKNIKGLMGVFGLSQFLRKEKIDIVQVHFRDASIAGILAARIAGVRKIVGTRRNQGYWHNKLELKIDKILNIWTTVVLVNSESTKKWAIEAEGISGDKIVVIYNAIDATPFESRAQNDSLDIRNELGIPEGGKVAGIVANLRPVKRLDIFLRAAALVLETVQNSWFVVVGEGKERANLEQLAQELGIVSQVRFTGSRLDVPKILSAFDVGVLTSDSESFSNAIVEYLSAGLPVVCTDVGGANEIIDIGVSGYISPAGNFQLIASNITEAFINKSLSVPASTSKNMLDSMCVKNIINNYQNIYSN